MPAPPVNSTRDCRAVYRLPCNLSSVQRAKESSMRNLVLKAGIVTVPVSPMAGKKGFTSLTLQADRICRMKQEPLGISSSDESTHVWPPSGKPLAPWELCRPRQHSLLTATRTVSANSTILTILDADPCEAAPIHKPMNAALVLIFAARGRWIFPNGRRRNRAQKDLYKLYQR